MHSRKPSRPRLSAFATIALGVTIGATSVPARAESQPDVKRVLLRTGADTVAVVRPLGGAQRSYARAKSRAASTAASICAPLGAAAGRRERRKPSASSTLCSR